MAADGNGKTVFKLPDGSKLDLKNLPSKDEDVTVAHLEVCRDAIFKLQKKLAVAGKKRSASTADLDKQGEEGVRPPTKKQKIKSLSPFKKAIIAGIKTDLRSKKFRSTGGWFDDEEITESVKCSIPMQFADFDALFLKCEDVELLQPRPDNKPKSKVYLAVLSGHAATILLGVKENSLSGTLWNNPRKFQKSYKIDTRPVVIKTLNVQFSVSTGRLVCTAKVKMEET